MKSLDDKWKREQEKEQKPVFIGLSSHIDHPLTCNYFLNPVDSLSPLSFHCLSVLFLLCLLTACLYWGTKRELFYVCVCVCVHTDSERKTKYSVLYYVRSFVSVVCVLWVNGEWWRQKQCVCVLTVTERKLIYSHSTIVLLAVLCVCVCVCPSSLLTPFLPSPLFVFHFYIHLSSPRSLCSHSLLISYSVYPFSWTTNLQKHLSETINTLGFLHTFKNNTLHLSLKAVVLSCSLFKLKNATETVYGLNVFVCSDVSMYG